MSAGSIGRTAERQIAIVGSPNAGKTSVVNALTGIRAKTANYPGVTVSRREATMMVGDQQLRLVDLPGTYGLEPISPDEAVVDRAAGNVMAGHGGALMVVAVDHTTVTLRAAGACEGCHRSNDTLSRLIEPAVRSAYPEIVEVVVENPTEHQPTPTLQRIAGPKRLRRNKRDRSCH